MMKFEPRLHIDAGTAGLIESTTTPLAVSPTVIVTDAYPFPLAAERGGTRCASARPLVRK